MYRSDRLIISSQPDHIDSFLFTISLWFCINPSKFSESLYLYLLCSVILWVFFFAKSFYTFLCIRKYSPLLHKTRGILKDPLLKLELLSSSGPLIETAPPHTSELLKRCVFYSPYSFIQCLLQHMAISLWVSSFHLFC